MLPKANVSAADGLLDRKSIIPPRRPADPDVLFKFDSSSDFKRASGSDRSIYIKSNGRCICVDTDISATGIQEERACGIRGGIRLEGRLVVGGVVANIESLVVVRIATDRELVGRGCAITLQRELVSIGTEGSCSDTNAARSIPQEGSFLDI